MDQLGLTVMIGHVDLDTPQDAEDIRADVERILQERGWDAEVTIAVTIFG